MAIDPDNFRRLLGQNNVELPVGADTACCGVIRDRSGTQVLVIDVDNDRPDAEVAALAVQIAIAINAAGGIATTEEAA